ncbi:MAG: hypothetical protein CEN91_17 [Candidatus Berkelbacteria bacterium Licking1014_85]|uniref:Antitoxin SocA-like Panacea domain-containing protein n=1 Tax=Candidatus Berkelbacteria bacterium Licking1014_85 TaxID=2017148 RepID=A0A554LMT0_9BACT|nr:MAG: hypothetical protein CEN91_17 [Candidatus Berkelbacteria bacterium Licking1014_85]
MINQLNSKIRPSLKKSQQLLYYIIQSKDKVEDKTKLAKLQYFADFIHYAFHGQPISQQEIIYTKQKQGLLSRNFTDDIEVLKLSGLIDETSKYNYVIKKKVNISLSNEEIRTVQYVLKKYGDLSYSDLVGICHSQVPYLATKEGAIAEFFTAYNLVDEYKDYAG